MLNRTTTGNEILSLLRPAVEAAQGDMDLFGQQVVAAIQQVESDPSKVLGAITEALYYLMLTNGAATISDIQDLLVVVTKDLVEKASKIHA